MTDDSTDLEVLPQRAPGMHMPHPAIEAPPERFSRAALRTAALSVAPSPVRWKPVADEVLLTLVLARLREITRPDPVSP